MRSEVIVKCFFFYIRPTLELKVQFSYNCLTLEIFSDQNEKITTSFQAFLSFVSLKSTFYSSQY